MRRQDFILAGFLALLALFPQVLPEFYVTLFNYIGLYAIVALGLVLLTGVGGLTSFGQAAFVGLGAYTTAYLTTATDLPGWLTPGARLALILGWRYYRGGRDARRPDLCVFRGITYRLGRLPGASASTSCLAISSFGGHTRITGIPALSVFGLK